MGILLKKFGEEGTIEITKRLSMNYNTFLMRVSYIILRLCFP